MAAAAVDTPATGSAAEALHASVGVEGDPCSQVLDKNDPLLDLAHFRHQAMESLFKERALVSRMPASAVDPRPCRKWVLGISEKGFRTWYLAGPKAKAELKRPVTTSTSVTQGGLGQIWKLGGMTLAEAARRMEIPEDEYEEVEEDIGFLGGSGGRARRRRRRALGRGGDLVGNSGCSCASASDSEEDDWDLLGPDAEAKGRGEEEEAEVVSLGSGEEIPDSDDDVLAQGMRQDGAQELAEPDHYVLGESDDDVLPMDMMHGVAKEIAELGDGVLSESDDDVLAVHMNRDVAKAPARGLVCLSDSSGDSDVKPLRKRRETASGSAAGGFRQLCTPTRGSRALLAGHAAASSAEKRPAPVVVAEDEGAKVGSADVVTDIPDWPI